MQQSFFNIPTQANTLVSCQPSMTPFIMQSINLNGMPANSASGSNAGNQASQAGGGEGGKAGGESGVQAGGVPFSVLSAQDVLAIPVPGQSTTTTAKLIYVKF